MLYFLYLESDSSSFASNELSQSDPNVSTVNLTLPLNFGFVFSNIYEVESSYIGFSRGYVFTVCEVLT